MNSKIKTILSYLLVLILGITIGITSYHFIDKSNKEKQIEEPTIKESPYTLEEIYEIIENPHKFYEENRKDGQINYLANVLLKFYDYFSPSTPFKIATKVIWSDVPGERVIEATEFKYISYAEYYELNKQFRETWEIKKALCEQDKDSETYEDTCNDPIFGIKNIMYEHLAEVLIYNYDVK